MLKQLPTLPASPSTVDIDIDNIAIMRSVAESALATSSGTNFTVHLSGSGLVQVTQTGAAAGMTATDAEYEQFLADVWVGVVLTLMVLSCVCCMCSCLLYHKFQQWKRSVIESREAADLESARHDAESLPSYTIASGLPSYEEALSQLKTVKEFCRIHNHSNNLEDRRKSLLAQLQVPQEVIAWLPSTPPTPRTSLSVTDLFQIYRRNSLNSVREEGIKTEL